MARYTVTGRLLDSAGQAVPDRTVRVFVRFEQLGERVVGRALQADSGGLFQLEFDDGGARPEPGIGRAVLVLARAYDGDLVIGESEALPLALKVELDIRIVKQEGERWLRVYGSVRDAYGELMPGVTVEALDRDMRSEQPLGTAQASEGRYEICYRRERFRRAERGGADLVLRVLDANGGELYRSALVHNAPDEFELDLMPGGSRYQGPSEWELLTELLRPLLDGVAPGDLSENEEHQDLRFLAGETGRSRLGIALWSACFRVAERAHAREAKLAPEVVFAFLRQDQPFAFSDTVLEDMQDPARVALVEEKILLGMAALAQPLQRDLLGRALAERLVPARIALAVEEILATLRLLRERDAGKGTFGGGKGTIGEVLELALENEQQRRAFLAEFSVHSGPMRTLWERLEKERILEPQQMARVKLGFEVGALTRNHVRLVGALLARFGDDKLRHKRELAMLNRSDWKRLFAEVQQDGEPIGVPANIDGDTEEARYEQFAVILEQQLQRAYPTTAFGATLARSERPPMPAATAAAIARFLGNNQTFFLDRLRVDHYLRQHPEALAGVQEPETLVRSLKSVQRVFKLDKSYKAVDALLRNRIDSAQQIYFMGPAQFMQRMEHEGLNALESRKLYRRAEHMYAAALTLFGEYNRQLGGVSLYGLPEFQVQLGAEAAIKALPNLVSLFGSLDYCACAHCRSVYSPAAYFVDVMRFLGERGTQGSGVHAGRTVLQVLLDRRPDLGEIELSCENTNTALPYIDLVNEVLEDAVAPPLPVTLPAALEAQLLAGPASATLRSALAALSVALDADALVYAPDSRGQWAIRDSRRAYRIAKTGATLQLLPTRQSFLSAPELRANPEYTNGAAYTTLSQQVFPLSLPFHLWQLQVRQYLAHLGVPQPRLLELFQQTLADGVTRAPSALQLDCAWLAITNSEHAILTATLVGKTSWDYWGLAQVANNLPNPVTPSDPGTNISGTWIAVLGHVDVMLHRTGLLYSELLQLLDMRYVNPTGSVAIADTAPSGGAGCDTSFFQILHLDAGVLDRMHRFIRLWRKLGCAMWELDIVLPDLSVVPGVTDKRITDAALQDISAMNRLRDETELDWRGVYSLYHGIEHQQYLDRGNDAAAVQTLYERLFRNKLVDAVAPFPPSPDLVGGTVAALVPGILAAFRIKEPDLELILADLGLTAASALDAAVLGRIYRSATLARVLTLSVDHFLRLKRLWAQDPFASPAATLALLRVARRVALSGLTIPELDYLLAHRFPAQGSVALDERAIGAALLALRQALQKISDDLRLKPEETRQAYVVSKLGLIPALDSDADQVLALAIVDGRWEGSLAERATLIARLFARVLDPAVAGPALAPLAAGLTPAQQQSAVDARFNYVQPELEAFLVRTQQDAAVVQKIAELFQLNVPAAGLLLTQLRLSGSAMPLLARINDSRLLVRLADNSYQFALDETAFPRIYEALRLLHKNALVIGKLRIAPEELRWWLQASNAHDFGFMHPNEFPITAAAPLAFAAWEALEQFFAWKGAMPGASAATFEFASRVLDPAVASSANLAELAALSGWDAADIDALAAAFHWFDAGAAFDQVKAALRKPANLVRLAEAMAALRRLGVAAARAVDWAVADPGPDQAESLKQTVKSKYDLPQWQKVIGPMQDTFREHKRQALVESLVAHPDQAHGQNWTDANGLYSYYLIDVEMSACMLTSRLKQAAGSAQMFVQRCLLNLELDILAKTEFDSRWKQWKWMKRYRVWEANRKIFLYPENWIEPELRDEKSPFFKELESQLMQNDVTQETAEQAFLSYLDKLDGVANLEIRALHDQPLGANRAHLHVVGRRRSSQTPEYYYRRRVDGVRWLAWEKGPEITGDMLATAVLNRRLQLFWPQFVEKADEPGTTPTPNAGQSSVPIAKPDRFLEARLYRSEYKSGKWSAKTLSDQFAVMREDQTTDHQHALRTTGTGIQAVKLYYAMSTQLAPANRADFEVIGAQIDRVDPSGMMFAVSETVITAIFASVREYREELRTDFLKVAPGSRVYDGLIQNQQPLVYHNYSMQYLSSTTTIREVKGLFSFSKSIDIHAPVANDAVNALPMLHSAGRGTYTVVDSANRSFNPNGDDQFFFWDRFRVYFVTYSSQWQAAYYGSRSGRRVSAFRFAIHYHPYVELFIKQLNIHGLKGLLNRRIQVDPASVPGAPAPFNFATYGPDALVSTPRPVEDVDFSYGGAYSPYNWELFFHVPFYIANRLSTNQRFEEALEWFHTIFDPTSTDSAVANPDTPQQKYWITKPFYETTKANYYKQKIDNIMLAIARGDAELAAQVSEWRDNPFNPHLIARTRRVAYQKNVLIKYIQTLIAWGDQLFRQDTIETINEASQLYILAASILGPRPRIVPRKVSPPVKTLYQLQKDHIDAFGNVLVELENLLPATPPGRGAGDDSPELPHLEMLYFCIPHNDKLMGLWDTVADRLFKIRHCMNIEGVVRQLALFEPPIDPALLVKAAAAGLDLGAVLGEMNAPLPLYRFTTTIQRALEVCAELKALGNAMLAVLERRDAEALTLLRSNHELQLLDQVRLVKLHQVDEAQHTWDSLVEGRKVVDERRKYYEQLDKDGLNGWEIGSLALSGGAIVAEIVATVLSAIAAGTSAIPQFTAGAAGFGGSPVFVVTTGGTNIAGGLANAANVVKSVSTILQMASNMTSTIGGYERRAQEWSFQTRLAKAELPQVDKQIAAASIRHAIAGQELLNHDRQRTNAESEDEFLRTTKFTNEQLYEWMVGQLSTVYFQSYQLAYDLAKRAERCLRFELGLSDSNYIQFGYWDSLKKGLLAGDRLFYDLKKLEGAYYEQSRREYELLKHVSLLQVDPVALIKLRQNGECFLELPETLFDMDYPGHYFRRIKSVALSIPCTAGPFATVACTLTLVSNRMRTSSQLLAGKYARDTAIEDPRFRDEVAAIQSIATSGAQNDHGMFELNFRDERYLPFEGAGALSTWHIKLSAALPQFDLASLADLVLHISYTAREGGELLRSKASEAFNLSMNELALAENRRGLYRIIDLPRELPTEWQRFLHPANAADDQVLVLGNLAERLPYFARRFPTKKVRAIEIVAVMADGANYTLQIPAIGTGAADQLTLMAGGVLSGMHAAAKDLSGAPLDFGAWTMKLRASAATNFKSLPADAVKELFMIINYTIA